MIAKIRKWKLSDAADLALALSNKKIQNNLRDGLPYPYTEQDGKEYISAMLSANENETFAFAITVDNKVIGSIGVFRQKNVHKLTAELGYYIAEEYWGQGIMTEALKAVMRFDFLELNVPVIYISHVRANIGSGKVQEKCGFEVFNEVPNYRVWIDGTNTDLVERKMTRDQYLDKQL